MKDAEIVKHINQLVGDYRQLEREHGGVGLTPGQRTALAKLQSEIDQDWATLRLRRARRNAGADPDLDRPLAGKLALGGRQRRMARTA